VSDEKKIACYELLRKWDGKEVERAYKWGPRQPDLIAPKDHDQCNYDTRVPFTNHFFGFRANASF